MSSISVSPDVLHRRLGHPSNRVVSHVQESCNPNVSINGKLNYCDACQFGKIHALPYNFFFFQTFSPLELIHTYIPCSNCFKPRIQILHTFHRYTWVYSLRSRAECHRMSQISLPMGLYRALEASGDSYT